MIYLGRIERSFMGQLREWRNDPCISKYCRQHDLISDVDQEKWFDKINTDKSISMYSILGKVGSCPVPSLLGVCGLTSIDHINRTAEFSLYIAPGHQKLGYGKEALKLLIDKGFKDLNLKTIYGETFEGNPAWKMFQKFGFKEEGILRERYYKNGKYIDCFIFSILRDEYELQNLFPEGGI